MADEAVKSTPVTGGADPAVLNPTRASSYDSARREKLAAFAAKDDSPEPEATEVETEVEEVVEADDPPAQATLDVDDGTEPDELEAAEPVESSAIADPELTEPDEDPEAEPDPDEPLVEPAEPKPYRLEADGGEVDLPEGLTITYKADGTERTRSFDEVIQFAQLGENFDRRSRELAQHKRDLETSVRQQSETLDRQFADAYSQMTQTLRRFFEDEQYREEALDEWYRITSNPEELELRIAAQRGQTAEQQLEQYRAREREEFEKKVWSTVDTIIAEKLADYDPELRDPLATRIRTRFHADLNAHGKQVLSQSHLADIIADERGVIDRAVARAREEAERTLAPRVAKAQAEAVVNRTNQTTDRALKRAKVVEQAPRSTNAATPVRAKPQIKTMQDAKKALERWQNG